MNPRGDWLAGGFLGSWSGLDLVYGPPLGALLLVAFVLMALILRTSAGVAGVCIGSGGVMLLLIALASRNCANDAVALPDLTGFAVVGAAIALIGATLSVRIVRESRQL